MKKIVIIGANDFQNPLILKAKELGYETHVFAWQDGSVGETTADYFYPISIVEKDTILEECRKIQPDAIATIASDLANITVQYVASRLGLPCNSDECIAVSTNKYLMRCALRDAGVATPRFQTVSSAEECDDVIFPVIVKPTDRSGSRGITKVLSVQELSGAIDAAVQHSFEKKAIIEEYIQGPEYSCECISFEGKHILLTLTQKFTTGAPYFIETGHIEPADLTDDMLEQVRAEVFAGLDALKIQNGASHAEFRITPEAQVRIIEIGSRMGGDCIGSDLVRISTGRDFVKMVIDTALGRMPDMSIVSKPCPAAIRFVFGERDLQILEKIRREAPEAIQFVSHIEDITDHKVVDSGTRYGFYILSAPTREELLHLSELTQ